MDGEIGVYELEGNQVGKNWGKRLGLVDCL